MARRAATRRYSYGFARAEDVAGIVIVLSIAISAGVILWESVDKLLNPQPITHAGWVAVAALIGFAGNEAVAFLQIRVGRKIGSAAMVADGLHARIDGLTSLAVLVAVGGAWLGVPILDPLIGLIMGVTILGITRNTLVTIWYRLMDAIEPELIAQAEAVVQHHAGVKAISRLRMRWMGHRLHADLQIAADPQLTIAASHRLAVQVRQELVAAIPNVADVIIEVEPWDEPYDHDSQHLAPAEVSSRTPTSKSRF